MKYVHYNCLISLFQFLDSVGQYSDVCEKLFLIFETISNIWKTISNIWIFQWCIIYNTCKSLFFSVILPALDDDSVLLTASQHSPPLWKLSCMVGNILNNRKLNHSYSCFIGRFVSIKCMLRKFIGLHSYQHILLGYNNPMSFL